MTITLRQESATGATTKGSALTYAELDNNFVHLLRQGSVTVKGDSGTEQTLGEADRDSILTIAGGTDISSTISSDSAGETVLTLDFTGSAGIANVVDDTTPQLGGSLDVNGNSIVSVSGGNINITPDGAGSVVIDGLSYPQADGTNGQILTTDGAGNLSFTDAASGGISNVVEDTTPQLGGELDGQGEVVSHVELKRYTETVHSLGSTDTPTLDMSNGNVQTITISAGLELPTIDNMPVGGSMTLIVNGSGSITTNTDSAGLEYKFAEGNKTLTTESVVSIFYDGTTYYASVATNFSA
jgi:hypothetical protein